MSGAAGGLELEAITAVGLWSSVIGVIRHEVQVHYSTREREGGPCSAMSQRTQEKLQLRPLRGKTAHPNWANWARPP